MPRLPNHPNIPARHRPILAGLIYYTLVRLSIWSHFDRVWFKLEGPLPQPRSGPLIAYLNHPSWWDGYMAFVLNRLVLRERFKGFLMMEEPQLRRYRFFAWCGCFSVDRHNARSAYRSVRYIGDQLAQGPDRSLWIFPQGTITPNDRRPLVIEPGIAHIARLASGAAYWPVALRYEFRSEQRPEAFIRAGPAHLAPPTGTSRDFTGQLAQRLTQAVDALRDDVLHDNLEEYRVVLRGRAGINRLFDRLWG